MRTLTAFFIFKMSMLLIGAASMFAGYHLFQQQIEAKAAIATQSSGEITAKFKGVEVSFKDSPPATVFLVMGVIIVIFTSLKGFTYENKRPDGSYTKTQQNQKS